MDYSSGFNSWGADPASANAYNQGQPPANAQQEKHMTQREKNREAVRNCRKRKKEHAKQLKERIEELVQENSKLRLELQLGGDSREAPEPQSAEEEQELINEMLPLVKQTKEGSPKTKKRRHGVSSGPPRSDTEIALRRKVQVYMERHQDHGRDRQKAISFILGRLHRLVVPEDITKQYLNIMTSKNGLALESSEWTGLKEQLQLTDEQILEFSKRRRYAKRLRTELDCAFERMQSIVERCRRNKKVGDSLNELTTILKPEQFARFVVWVHNNPACKDILDELWGKLLANCDVQINKEILGSETTVSRIKRLQENSAALAIHLFSIVDANVRGKIAKLCVHKDCILVDANNNVDKKGIKAVTRYMSYVTHAFDTQSCSRTNSLRALNVEEKSIVSDQQDDKVTGTWRLSGVYTGKLKARKSNSSPSMKSDSPAMPFGISAGSAECSTSSSSSTVPNDFKLPPSSFPLPPKDEPKKVSFNVIVEFSFGDPTKPELCTEMIISWDAMSLVGQLGLLNSPQKGVLPPPNVDIPEESHEASFSGPKNELTLRSAENGATKVITPASPSSELAAVRRKNCMSLAKLFQLESKEEMETLANEIFHPKCLFDDIHMGAKYKGVPLCLSYIRRLRRAFPKFEIDAKILSEAKVEQTVLRTRTSSHGSSPSESSVGTASPKLSLSVVPDLVEMKWEIHGYYGGALVKDQKPCKIDGKVFVTLNPKTAKITQAKLDIVAQDLMFQLGILHQT